MRLCRTFQQLFCNSVSLQEEVFQLIAITKLEVPGVPKLGPICIAVAEELQIALS